MYEETKKKLLLEPSTWLITGVAGFIGSNLLEHLLKLNQRVVGIDNYSTGRKENLDEVCSLVEKKQWDNFVFIRGDIRNLKDCFSAMQWDPKSRDNGYVSSKIHNVEFVLHQAALGSVPRSIKDPIITNQCNVEGFLNLIVSARDTGVKRVVYASSSAVYGDSLRLPKVEHEIGKPLSPYAVSKYINELYAGVFLKNFDLKVTGLRYFNVFGKRQDPSGSYAAVIPKWINEMKNNKPVYIFGDGETSRDFCHIDNVVQANLLAAVSNEDQIFNIAFGHQTTLNELFIKIKQVFYDYNLEYIHEPIHKQFRLGDINRSLADISNARKFLGYNPTTSLEKGLNEVVFWNMKNSKLLENHEKGI